MKSGLVVGKFYPLHLGHVHLLKTAAANCDFLWVIVGVSDQESIPGHWRKRWIEQELQESGNHFVSVVTDNAPIDYDDPKIWDAHIEIFQRVVPKNMVDVVFASELYCEELAWHYDAESVFVDIDRTTVPVSGTAIRKDPVANWQYLPAEVKADLTKRIALVGAESSGTTTLAKALAYEYNTIWVPEFGRYYAEGIWRGPETAWETRDFDYIARIQQATEDTMARKAGPVMFCDTTTLSTSLFHELYMGSFNPYSQRRYPLTLVTSHEGVPFEEDGLRANEHDREWMTEAFVEELGLDADVHFVTVSGSPHERVVLAKELIDGILRNGWNFPDPLG